MHAKCMVTAPSSSVAPDALAQARSNEKTRISIFRRRCLLGLTLAAFLLLAFAWGRSHRQVVSLSTRPVAVPLGSISLAMQDATVAMEDGHFYQHRGFDWEAIQRALAVDWQEGRIAQGGSTITQQLAKNAFLSKNRTFWRKVEEVPLTLEMERTLSKRRILELYLNTIDYGMDQRGIRDAATFYFHTTPTRLTLAQSAVLVGLVPHPPQTMDEFYAQSLEQDRQTALDRIAYFFPGRYLQAELDRAGQTPLKTTMYPFKDALDRGATQTIPAVWRDVGFFFFADPQEPTPIPQVSASLKPALAGFIDDARCRYNITGIDHLGVYNDRPMRQSQTEISAHAYGQAIDVSGFRFKDGSEVLVKDHADPEVAVRLAPLEALLKVHFPIVVDWRDDPLRHQTHFHCEVRGPRSTATSIRRAG